MPSQILRVSLVPWAPGLRDQSIASFGDPGKSAATMFNVTPHPAGYTTRRGGYRITKKCDTNTTRVAGIFGGRFSGRTGDDFFVVSTDKNVAGDVYQEHVIYSQFVDTAGFNIKSDGSFGSVSGTVPDYLVTGNTLFIANPNRSVISYNKAAGVSFEEYIPSCSFLSFYKTRLFCANLKDDADKIAYSIAGDPRAFVGTYLRHDVQQRVDAAGIPTETMEEARLRDRFQRSLESVSFSISDRSDQVVTGLSDGFYGDLYAFTGRTINRIRVLGDALPQREVISQSVGCSGNQTIKSVGNDLVWISEKGVHSLMTTQKYGDVESSFLSAPIQRLWDRINPKNMERACAVYSPKDELYLLAIDTGQAASLSVAGDGPMILVLHVPSGRWSVWDIPATAMTVSSYAGIYGANVIVGGEIDGLVQVGILGTADSFDVIDEPTNALPPVEGGGTIFTKTAFESLQETEWINAGDAGVKKNWRGVTVYFRSGADSLATLYWQGDSLVNKWNMGTQATRASTYRSSGITFHLNPGGEAPTLSDSEDLSASNPEQYGIPLGDSNTAMRKAYIPLAVSCNAIKFWIQTTAGHPFELFGIDVHYIPESSRTREIVEGTGTERTIAISAGGGLARTGTVDIGAGDGVTISD